MDLRIFTEPQQGATYDDLLAVARTAEDLGFDGFFRSDHYLHTSGDGGAGPTDAWTTWPGSPGRPRRSGSARSSPRPPSATRGRWPSRWPASTR